MSCINSKQLKVKAHYPIIRDMAAQALNHDGLTFLR